MNLFRFRRHAGKILKIYACLAEADVRGLHPMQISRVTGISFREVARRLDSTPELFVRLVVARGQPRRYTLNTRARAMNKREVEQLVQRGVMRESLILYSIVVMILLALIMVILFSIPVYQAGFDGYYQRGFDEVLGMPSPHRGLSASNAAGVVLLLLCQ